MKQEAIYEVKKQLQNIQNDIRSKLRRNIFTMKGLVEEQTRLKREIGVYHKLIKSLD